MHKKIKYALWSAMGIALLITTAKGENDAGSEKNNDHWATRTWTAYIGAGVGGQSAYSPTACVAGACTTMPLPIAPQYSGLLGIEIHGFDDTFIILEYQYAIAPSNNAAGNVLYTHNNLILGAEHFMWKQIGVGLLGGVSFNNITIQNQEVIGSIATKPSALLGAKIEAYPIKHLGLGLRYIYYFGYSTTMTMSGTTFMGAYNVSGTSAILVTMRYVL